MKPKIEKSVVPSFDELVFEHRNKEYGAYTLRKKYNKALLISMLLGTFFIGATVITPYAIYKPTPTQKPIHTDTVAVEFVDPNLLVNQKVDPPKPLVDKPPVMDYSKPEVVDSITSEEAKKFLSQEDLKDAVVNDSVTNYEPVNKKPEIDPEPDDLINESFTVTEKPLFGIDGDNEFRGWITKTIIYPPDAVDVGLQGRVYLRFVVEKDGSISNIEVIKSADPILSKEAVRVIEMSPKWTPGKINGTPVRVRVNFPITFALNVN